MGNLIIGIILLHLVIIDYFIKEKDKSCGFYWRLFATFIGILNLVIGL